MKALVFDTSSIISIAMNNLLEILEPLKEKFNGEFLITKHVKKELVDVPLRSRKYKLEAIMLRELIEHNILRLYKDEKIEEKAWNMLSLVNKIYIAKNNYIKIIHEAEIEALAAACYLGATYVVDERTIRLLVEKPKNLAEILKKKLQTNIKIDEKNLIKVQREVCNVKIIRSADLMTVAYELGLLNKFHANKQELLDGLLWGLKLRGCSISSNEIEDVLSIETRNNI